MKQFVLFLFISLPFLSTAQNYLDSWSSEELSKAKTAEEASYLTPEEKAVVLYMNLARLNPKKFKETILIPYIKDHEWNQGKEYKSLIRELDQSETKGVLSPRKDLYEFALIHAQDMGKTGKIGHNSSRGVSFQKRIKPLQETFIGVGENCQYGFEEGIAIVLDLLIDEGIPDYGHRKNILNETFIYCGVSIAPHKKYGYNCVQEFGAALK